MLGLTTLGTLVIATSIFGQEPQQTPSTTTLDDVVVEGRSLRDQVSRFIDDVLTPPVRRGPARWRRTVCVGVLNMQRDAAQALADRISTLAMDIGLEAGEPGCRPDILVIATSDGRALAEAMVRARPVAFRPQYAGSSRNAGALERFQEGDAAVRWWHVAMPVVADSGRPAIKLPGRGAPLVPGGTRLRTELTNDLTRAFVIIDMDEAVGLTVQQLGDYIGMVALSQVDPDADTSGFDTVLNLFEPNERHLYLTAWDSSYLRALYGAELRQRNATHQAGEVTSLMTRDRVTEQAPQDEEE